MPMSRKISVFVAAVALAMSSHVFAAEPVTASAPEPVTNADCARAESPQQEVPLRTPAITLAQLFAASSEDETIDVLEGVASGSPAMEVVMARIDTDGSIVMSCVDTEQAAKHFLAAPVEKLVSKKAKEQ
jgi:hypothetical protein